MGPKHEVPVFAETDLGTHIALAVSPDITAGDFKRELKRAHTECFPELGFLDFKTVMVKQKSKFYCLPDLLPLKSVCWGCDKLCFVNVVGCLSNELGEFQAPKSLLLKRRAIDSQNNDCIVVNKNSANIRPEKRKLIGMQFQNAVQQEGLLAVPCALKKKIKGKRRHILNKFSAGNNSETLRYSNSTVETSGESLSGGVSVSGIIDRYFSNLIELNQIGSPSISEIGPRGRKNELKEQGDTESTNFTILASERRHSVIKKPNKLSLSTSPEACNSVGLRRYKRSEVGQRLVTASNTLQVCQTKQSSRKSNLSWSKNFWQLDACSVAKCLVFEIGDDD